MIYTALRFLFLLPALFLLPLLAALGILALLFYFVSVVVDDSRPSHWINS